MRFQKIYQKARNDQPPIFFSSVAEYRINLQKAMGFLYTSNKYTEKKIVNTLPLIMILNKIKYLEISLIPVVKCLTSENVKPL